MEGTEQDNLSTSHVLAGNSVEPTTEELQPSECLIRARKRCGSDEASTSAIRQRQQEAKVEDPPATSSVQAEKNISKLQQQTAEAVELGQLKKFTLDSLLALVKAVIALYDLVSQPVYYLKDEVYKRQHEIDCVQRSLQIDPQDPNSPWRQVKICERQLQIESRIDSFETYDEMMQNTFKIFGDRPCYAYRSILHEQWIKRPDSDKLQRQVRLSDYKWITFAQFEQQIEAARRGFLLNGVQPGDKVMLYADTRPEWQISSQSLIRLGAIVGTMYATLGVDGIVHSINEIEVSHVVAQKDKVNRLLKLKPKLPLLKRIIYFDDSLELPEELGGNLACNNTDGQVIEFEHPEIECTSFGQLLVRGVRANQWELDNLEKQQTCNEYHPGNRNKDSIAIIMYTSGSTGIPKGVLINHRNIMASVKSFSYVIKDFVHEPKKHIFTAYLPLAHIFEFCFESLMLFHGIRYGFATPHTLTDKSPGLVPGQKGDLGLLKPSVMIIVPLMVDRIVQNIKQTLRGQSYFKRQLINHLIKYKIRWQKSHYETPIVNRFVCSKFGAILGGQAKYVVCGSAPLSGETQTFVRAALNLRMLQGFGTTETCAATACQLFEDQSTGNVGLPIAGSMIKLEPWEEGNYTPSDKPNPRGEIVVGGEMIAQGYYKLDEQTEEAFYVDIKGTRWYRTGDIGEFLPNGNLKIIDRKKDLVKLQNGEYISLGKVESTLKSNPFTENICVYVNSAFNYVVALGPANEAAIRSLAQQIVDEFSSSSRKTKSEQQKALLSNNDNEQQLINELKEILTAYENDRLDTNGAYQEGTERRQRRMSSLSVGSLSACIDERLHRLCTNQLVQARVLESITNLARERDLMNLEIPRKLLLLAEEWTADKNLVTAALKIRRNYIYKRYEQQLAQLYTTT